MVLITALHSDFMRSSIAMVLAVLFISLLIRPAFPGVDSSALPVCCRKHGNHHCTMLPSWSGAPAASVQKLGEKCPYFPHSLVAEQVQAFTPAASQAIFAWSFPATSNLCSTQTRYRASHRRSKQKRAPPIPSFRNRRYPG